jgi:hypothetical protein
VDPLSPFTLAFEASKDVLPTVTDEASTEDTTPTVRLPELPSPEPEPPQATNPTVGNSTINGKIKFVCFISLNPLAGN